MNGRTDQKYAAITASSKQGLRRLALAALMLLVPPYAASSAQQAVEYPTLGGEITLQAKSKLMQAGYIMVGYEQSPTAESSELSVKSVRGAPAVLTCNIAKGHAGEENRDCNGSSQTMYYTVTGDRHFSREIEFSDELMTSLRDDSGASIEINVTYL